MRKLFLTVFVVLLTASVAMAASLSLNHVGAIDHPYHAGSLRFAELVAEYSNGEVTVDVFPASQIASGARAVEFVQLGTLDIALESTMAFSNFVPEIGVLDMPFMFDSKEEAFRMLDTTDVGRRLEELSEERGFKVLAWWDNGFRNVTSTRGPIERPEDFAGLKIRTPESRVFLATFEAMGAVPTPMAVADVFQALQLGIVDAQENPDNNNIDNRFIEVAQYYSVTKHMYTAEPLIMSLERFNSFPPAHQDAIFRAAREAGEYNREISRQRDEVNMVTIANTQGVVINIVEDLTPFKEATRPVYDAFYGQFGELLRLIEAAR